jgi:flagellar basal-body rod protein FlgF
MSSGIYSALSGNLARMQLLESLANNLANANTVGFKKDRLTFEATLSSTSQTQTNKGLNFTRLQKSYIDFAPGNHQFTGNNLDLAIEGEGFFKIRQDDTFLYTRNGRFHLGPDGSLLTDSALEVVGSNGRPLVIPAAEFTIDQSGRILVEGAEVGRVSIFTVDDLSVMSKEGEGLFALPPNQKDRRSEDTKVLQGYLEGSNVNMMEEMVLMMEALRAFEAHQKMVKNYGRLSSKLDELGSL